MRPSVHFVAGAQALHRICIWYIIWAVNDRPIKRMCGCHFGTESILGCSGIIRAEKWRSVMKKRVLGKGFAATICVAGLCAFSSTALAQENVALPLDETGAETIALADAGVEETDVSRLYAVREREDGENVVEVEFSCGDNHYEYMLRETDGMILEWSIEGRAVKDAVVELTLSGGEAALSGSGASADTQGSGTAAEVQTEVDPSAEGQAAADTPDGNTDGDDAQGGSAAAGSAVVKITVDGTELIGYEQAVQIALDDSGIAEADAELAKIKFEYDGRFYDYELELREGRAEYEYKIDAQSGEIVEVERD